MRLRLACRPHMILSTGRLLRSDNKLLQKKTVFGHREQEHVPLLKTVLNISLDITSVLLGDHISISVLSVSNTIRNRQTIIQPWSFLGPYTLAKTPRVRHVFRDLFRNLNDSSYSVRYTREHGKILTFARADNMSISTIYPTNNVRANFNRS